MPSLIRQRKQLEAKQADADDLKMLEDIENQIKGKSWTSLATKADNYDNQLASVLAQSPTKPTAYYKIQLIFSCA